MVVVPVPLTKIPTEHSSANKQEDFRAKCARYSRTAEQQAARAGRMSKLARKMSDRAVAMRKVPHVVLP